METYAQRRNARKALIKQELADAFAASGAEYRCLANIHRVIEPIAREKIAAAERDGITGLSFRNMLNGASDIVHARWKASQ